jgi:small subunit ribosomal protein S7
MVLVFPPWPLFCLKYSESLEGKEMPRRREVPKRYVLPDPKFNSRLAAKFINNVMRRGKKSTSEQIFYQSLTIIEQRSKQDPLDVFHKALENVRPVVEVKSRRVGGATYQVPVEVRSERRDALAMRWIISYAKSRSEKTMTQKLAGELMDASQNRGGAVKKREDTHRMADANKAFAHYRW